MKGRSDPHNFLWPVLSVFLVSLIAGCVKVDQTLSLESDGSGTLDLVYGMSEQTVAQMKAMTQSMLAESATNKDANTIAMDFDYTESEMRNDFEAYEPYGVTLDSMSMETRDGWKYRSLKIRFKTLDGLAKTPWFSDRVFSLSKNEAGNYELVRAAGNNSMNMAPPAESNPNVDEMVAGMMKGFQAVIRIKTPSPIIESNAESASGDTAEWVFDLEKDPKALEKAQTLTMKVVFNGQGLSIPEFKRMAVAGD